MSEIYLVSMPFVPLELPPIAIGQLVAVAKHAGMDVEAIYPSLRFAKLITIPRYRLIADIAGFNKLLGEWLFARAAYQEFDFSSDEYLTILFRDDPEFRKYVLTFCKQGESSFISELHTLRETAERFIEKTAQEIVEQSPRIVGCSTSFQQYSSSLALLQRIKRLNPSIITMVGGANCEAEMGYITVQKFSWIDVVVSGEADTLFPDLCQKILKKGMTLLPEEIPYGIYCKSKVVTAQNAETALVHNIEDLPFPDYSGYFKELARTELHRSFRPTLLLESSRGCEKGQRNPCTFCGVHDTKYVYRAKSSRHILQELEYLYTTYGIHRFMMVGTISNLPGMFQELSQQQKPYKFVLEEPILRLNEEHMRLLAEAGVIAIQSETYSLHRECSRLLYKGNSEIETISLLKYALEQGISVLWDFPYHIPGDRPGYYQEMAELLPLLYHLEPPRPVSLKYHLRFSQYCKTPHLFGLKLSPLPIYQHVYPFTSEELDLFAYFFEEKSKRTLGEPGIATLIEQINEWRTLFYDLQKNHAVRPKLTLTEKDGEIMILDTRPCAIAERFVLTGIERAIYKACRQPVTTTALYNALHVEELMDRDKESVECGIDQLLHKRLLLQMNGKYLALAVFTSQKATVRN